MAAKTLCTVSLVVIGLSGILAMAPLLLTAKCHVPAWQQHEFYVPNVSSRDFLTGAYHTPQYAALFGDHVARPVTGAWLAGVLVVRRNRFHLNDPIQRLVLVYSAFTLVQSLLSLLHPWLFSICPQNLEVFHGLLRLCDLVFYSAAQLTLMRISHLRLHLVAAHVAAKRAAHLWRLEAVAIACLAVTKLLGIFDVALPYVEEVIAILLVLGFIALQVNAFLGLRSAAQKATEEASLVGSGMEDAARAGVVANILAVSALTTLVFIPNIVYTAAAPSWGPWLHQVAVTLDIPSDALLALLAAEVLHDHDVAEGCGRVTTATRWQTVGSLVEQRRARLIRDQLIASVAAESGPALAVAALLDGVAADELVGHALDRFRSVAWQTLEQHSGIITEGGLLQDVGAGAADLHGLSAPCRLSGCDAFWSHSWRDDGGLKWAAVGEWAATFHADRGRWPRLWLDKVCIDQSSIADDLRCLPVFLAGCNGLLVTSGSTYASRLWCALELFVYYSMAVEDSARSPPIVKLFAPSDAATLRVRTLWLSFDVTECNCFHAEDKRRIVQVISQFPRGTVGFNDNIRDLARVMLGQLVGSNNAVALLEFEEGI